MRRYLQQHLHGVGAAVLKVKKGVGTSRLALAVGGNVGFAAAVSVQFVVGYKSWLHFAPAVVGWYLSLLALGLTREWMCRRGK